MTQQKNKKDLPVPTLSRFHLEAERTSSGMSIMVSGAVGIRELTEEHILVLSHSGTVAVKGKRLRLTVYDNNALEIKGRIEEVSFGYGKVR